MVRTGVGWCLVAVGILGLFLPLLPGVGPLLLGIWLLGGEEQVPGWVLRLLGRFSRERRKKGKG